MGPKMLAVFSRTAVFYPSAAETELQMHVKIPETRMEMFINTNNWKEHFTASSSVSTRQGHWVALGPDGGPPRRIPGVSLASSVSVIVFRCSQVERGSLCHPLANPATLPGTSKVSWTRAQINQRSDPAGVVSGSAGQRGDKLVFVQQKLRVVLYLKRAIITSVTGVLTGRRSCRGAVHHGIQRPTNRWALDLDLSVLFVFSSAYRLHMANRLGADGSDFFGTRPTA